VGKARFLALIHPGAGKVNSPKLDFHFTAFSEGRQESFNDRPCGDASHLAMLLDWVHPLR
jgi:hypothetical protein